MKVVTDYPPNYELLKATFKLQPNVVFTYGDTLYNPGGGVLEEHLMVHEETHAKQQSNADSWWKRYIEDKEFRLSQELEAYRAQYQYLLEHNDRAYRRRVLRQISKDLSGGIYGNLLSQAEAKALIKEEV